MNKRSNSNLKTVLIYFVIVAVMIFILSGVFSEQGAAPVTYSDVVKYFQTEQVTEFSIDTEDVITMKLKDGKILSYQFKDTDYFREDLGELILSQLEKGTLTSYEYEPPVVWPWWVALLPYLALIIIFAALWFYVVKQTSGKGGGKMNSFGRARVKTPEDAKSRVTFRDVAGAEEEKAELEPAIKKAIDVIKAFGTIGVDRAMNQYNTKGAAAEPKTTNQ